jgi:hypothetical protein
MASKASKRKSTDSTDSTEIITDKKPKSNSKTKTTDSEDLAKALAWVYLNTAYSWIFNCDSGCFYDVCQKAVRVQGIWIIIYQPMKSMLEYDDMVAAIIIKRIDKQAITQKMLSDANPFIKQVEKLYLQSYNDILSVTGNKWTHSVDGTLDKIMQIREPLKLVNGELKMKFEIRGAVDYCCGDSWYPAKLMAWFGKSTSYAPINENGEIQDKEELEKFKYPAELAVIVE